MQCLWYASHVLYESRVTLANTIIVQLFLHLPTHNGKTRFVWVCFLCINGSYLVSRVELWGHHGIDHKVIVKPDSTDQWECIFATSQSTHSLYMWLVCAILRSTCCVFILFSFLCCVTKPWWCTRFVDFMFIHKPLTFTKTTTNMRFQTYCRLSLISRLFDPSRYHV